MLTTQVLALLRELLIVTIAFIFQYILLESRFTRTKTLIILIAGTLCVILLNMAFVIPIDYLLYKKLFPLTVSLPIFVLFMIVSKHKGFLVLFNLLTAVFLCYVTAMFGYMLSMFFQFNLAVSIIGQIAAFPLVLLFVLKVFRPLYLLMLDRLKKGWALFLPDSTDLLCPVIHIVLLSANSCRAPGKLLSHGTDYHTHHDCLYRYLLFLSAYEAAVCTGK